MNFITSPIVELKLQHKNQYVTEPKNDRSSIECQEIYYNFYKLINMQIISMI